MDSLHQGTFFGQKQKAVSRIRAKAGENSLSITLRETPFIDHAQPLRTTRCCPKSNKQIMKDKNEDIPYIIKIN